MRALAIAETDNAARGDDRHKVGVEADVCVKCGASALEITDGQFLCSAGAVARWRAGAEERRVQRELDLWKQDLDYREVALCAQIEAFFAATRNGDA